MPPAASPRVNVPPAQHGQRADTGLAQLLGCSTHHVKRLCALGLVRCGTRVLRKGDALRAGDVVDLLAPQPAPGPVPPLDILCQHADCVVVNKPAGVPSHRLRPTEAPAMLEAVVAWDPAVALAGPDPREGGLLHRLDRNTSGALAFARNPQAYLQGRQAFSSGGARKLYTALVHGTLPGRGLIEAAITQDSADHRRAAVVTSETASVRGKPQPATTWWRTLARAGADALVLVDAQGGRRHQVRVHLAHAGAPLWGDDLYGGPAWNGPTVLPGHALHALWLAPGLAAESGGVTAPAPQAFADAVEQVLGPDGVAALAEVQAAPDGINLRG